MKDYYNTLGITENAGMRISARLSANWLSNITRIKTSAVKKKPKRNLRTLTKLLAY
jgi:hypothetical protein